MTLKDGKCFCTEGDQRLNAEGECVDCFIDGCVLCKDHYQCSECQERLTLVDGLCTCPAEGERPNPQGECETCNVEGCSSCAVGDPDTCVKCFDCSASLIDGKCQCNYEGAIWNDLGFCSTAEEEALEVAQQKVRAGVQRESKVSSSSCPSNCEEGECSQGHCRECEQGYYLQDNKCLKCDITCSHCAQADRCTACKGGFSLTPKATCEQCKVLHC